MPSFSVGTTPASASKKRVAIGFSRSPISMRAVSSAPLNCSIAPASPCIRCWPISAAEASPIAVCSAMNSSFVIRDRPMAVRIASVPNAFESSRVRSCSLSRLTARFSSSTTSAIGRIFPVASKNLFAPSAVMRPSSIIASRAGFESGTSRWMNVLKLVPASLPEAKSGAMPAMAAAKSANSTPAAEAAPPPCAMASDISSTPNRETLAAPASRFTVSVRSAVERPQTAIAVETVSAACTREVEPAAARSSAARAAPSTMSFALMPFAASTSIACVTSPAEYAVDSPRSSAVWRRAASSPPVAPATEATMFSCRSKSALDFSASPSPPATAPMPAAIPAIATLPTVCIEEPRLENAAPTAANRPFAWSAASWSPCRSLRTSASAALASLTARMAMRSSASRPGTAHLPVGERRLELGRLEPRLDGPRRLGEDLGDGAAHPAGDPGGHQALILLEQSFEPRPAADALRGAQPPARLPSP
nr:hypothetical protein [Tepidiforma sp.]